MLHNWTLLLNCKLFRVLHNWTLLLNWKLFRVLHNWRLLQNWTLFQDRTGLPVLLCHGLLSHGLLCQGLLCQGLPWLEVKKDVRINVLFTRFLIGSPVKGHGGSW